MLQECKEERRERRRSLDRGGRQEFICLPERGKQTNFWQVQAEAMYACSERSDNEV
jgi:hypothetical protein